VFLGLLLLGTAAYLAWRGWSFYTLSLEERVEHPEFRQLRPTGFLGAGYGFVATALVFANLFYLVRRRFAGTAALGSLRVWLDVHVFTGLLAAVFVAFHSSFQLRTPIATATAGSLAMVVLTGMIGRLLHALVPRNDRSALEDATARLEDVLPGAGLPVLAAARAFAVPHVPANASLARALGMLPALRRVARDRREAVAAVIEAHTPPTRLDRRTRRALRRAAALTADAAAGEARAVGATAILRSWRSLHRLFAILMLLTVALHAGVAWHYGYRWIFSR
jgi:hypothetical protein